MVQLKKNNVSCNYKFHVFRIIWPTYNCKSTIKWYENTIAMIWHLLSEKCLHSGLDWTKYLHILSDWSDLLCNSPYSVQIQEQICTRENPEHGVNQWFDTQVETFCKFCIQKHIENRSYIFWNIAKAFCQHIFDPKMKTNFTF